MDNKIKHLELIQGIINRMAGNSFMLKGWAVTLVAGIFSCFICTGNYFWGIRCVLSVSRKAISFII